ncbi:unnamed protein product [Blepharisma stoltei]|uniref:Kelch motif family protein n=1 Tax=Blepharisma stoltei TaxID=1481888 RepID=A0AAU9J0J4_9CILI|nr:unnamed protein product [Blepharisma stoltei]
MGACCGKNKKPTQTPKPTTQPKPVTNLQAPPAVEKPPAPVVVSQPPQVISIFKPIPNSRKVFFFSVQENKAFILTASLPFPFSRNCGICQLSQHNFIIAGGNEYNSDELTSDAMIFEGKALSGRRIASMPAPSAMQTLIYIEKIKLVYAVGGLQVKTIDESNDDHSDLIPGNFSVYDLKLKQWNVLEQMPKKLCCPTCYFVRDSIFAAGGFILKQDKFARYETIQVYNLQEARWKILQLKFTLPVVGALAVPLEPKQILIVGGMKDLNTSASMAYLFDEEAGFSNLKDFKVSNIQFVPPVYRTEKYVYILAEPEILGRYDRATKEFEHFPLMSLMQQNADIRSLNTFNSTFNGIYTYHCDLSNKTITTFNTLSQEKSSIKLQSIQYRDAGIAFLPDGSLFFAGGVAANSPNPKPTNQCFRYDPVSQTEEAMTQLPKALRGIRLISTQDTIIAIAGFDDSESSYKEVYSCYIKFSDQIWVDLPNMLIAVRYPACCLLENSIYVIGGEEVIDEGIEEIRDCIQVCDLSSMVWTVKTLKYNIPAKCMGLIPFTEKTVLIFGGEDADGNEVKSSYEFDGENFRKAEDLPGDAAVMHFDDPACIRDGEAYIFNSAGDLYRLDFNSLSWEEVEAEEKSVNQI